MLAEEAAFQGHDPVRLPEGCGHHAAALWYLLEFGPVFHRVRLIRDADDREGRYWHRTDGLPARPPDLSPGTVQQFKGSLADFFRTEQGRGHRVTVEHFPRPGGETCVFCYPDDYTQTHVGHDDRGTLRWSPIRPAFEVVFVFDPATGVLGTYAPGPRAVRQALEDRFCKAVLGVVPAVEQPRHPAS